MSRIPRIVSAAVAAALVAVSGQTAATQPVATLSRVTGVALVNLDADYVTATQGMALREGDRLLAMEGSTVVIKFGDGCVYELPSNSILTIGGPDSCTTGSLADAQIGPYLAEKQKIGGLILDPGVIAAGTLAALVAAGIASNTGSDNRTSSPTLSP